MKTTVELPNSLLERARRVAAERGTTIRALVEETLRRVLEEHERPQSFRLRDASFAGEGLSPEYADASWDALRDTIYRGRGT